MINSWLSLFFIWKGADDYRQIKSYKVSILLKKMKKSDTENYWLLQGSETSYQYIT